MKAGLFYILGILTGFANGLFGSGGGMIAVPLLNKSGIEQKKAQATSMAITLPMSLVSVIIYLSSNHMKLTESLIYVPGGLIGAIFGGVLLKKAPNKLLKKVFGGLLIIAGVRTFL